MTSSRLAALAVAAVLAVASPARAQSASPSANRSPATGSPAAAPADQRPPDQLRKEVYERMRALRAFKIVEELKLDENASARLFPILAKYDDRETALDAERREIIRELRVQVESSHPDDARLGKEIERLLANRARRHDLHDQQIKDLRKVLTPVQQAKLVLLLPRLEREFAQWVHDSAGRD